jgi:hypothetical protein
VIRNNRMYPVTLMVGVVCLLQGLLNSSPNLTVFFLVFGTFAVILSLWPRVIVTADGVTVINVRARTLAWDEIDAVEARTRRGTVNLVFRAGGEDIRAFAMRGSAWGYLNSEETVERVAAQISDERRRRTGQVETANV